MDSGFAGKVTDEFDVKQIRTAENVERIADLPGVRTDGAVFVSSPDCPPLPGLRENVVA